MPRSDDDFDDSIIPDCVPLLEVEAEDRARERSEAEDAYDAGIGTIEDYDRYINEQLSREWKRDKRRRSTRWLADPKNKKFWRELPKKNWEEKERE